MSRPITYPENLQVRLPDRTKERMRRYLPVGETNGGFWRKRMLAWLDRMETATPENRMEGEDG